MELWRKAFQVTIDAYYAGDLNRGADACEALLASQDLPVEIELQTRRNSVFYASPLNELLPPVDTWPLRIPMPHEGGLRYPSIANGENDLRMLVCWSPTVPNDERRERTALISPDSTPAPLLLHVAADLDIRELRPIQDELQPPGPTSPCGSSCKAAHLIHHDSSWWICCSADESTVEHRGSVTLFRLDGHAVSQRQRCDAHIEQPALQSWLPVANEADGSLWFVTSLDPVNVLSYRGGSGVAIASTSPGSPLLRWCRGGTQLVPVEQGWLGIVNEVVDFGEGSCTTLHRFVWLDALWRLARISLPWVFQIRGAELAMGLALRGGDLLISYGGDQRDAWLAIAPLSDVMRLLAAPLDLDGAQRRLRREAVAAVAAGTLPVPAQPAPIPPQPTKPTVPPTYLETETIGESTQPSATAPNDMSIEEPLPRGTAPDPAVLSRYAQDHPSDAQGFSRLADALVASRRFDEAIAALRICARLADDDETGAWAMYRAAECFLAVDRPMDALEVVMHGMARHAGLGELPWLAAYASWQANRPAQAAYWARRAIALGLYAGTGEAVARGASRYPAALWEGPFDILRFALRRLGDDAGADEAELLFHHAKRGRGAVG